jgi:glycosyltransferase involved in cell wall biosynthesis
MKILHLTSDYPPEPLWGMGWHVYFLVQALKELELEVVVGTAHKSYSLHNNIVTTSAVDDTRLLSCGKYEIFNDFSKFNFWQEYLADKLIDLGIEPDIVHCHNWMSWITTKKLACKYSSAKIVFTFHLLQKQYDLMIENPIPEHHDEIVEIEREAIHKTDRIVVLSDAQRSLLFSSYGKFDEGKVTLIPGGVDFSVLDYQSIEKKKRNNTSLDVIFVGRIEKDKGIEQTLQAFSKVLTKVENDRVRLHIVGKGPLLNRLSREYGSQNIVFHGFIGRNNLRALLEKSHVFCMPSTSEGMATTVIEAMMLGVVPIFTEGETVPSLFEDNIHGLKVKLYRYGDKYLPTIDDIFHKIMTLIKNESLLYKLSRNAHKYANNNFTLKSMAEKTFDLYRRL